MKQEIRAAKASAVSVLYAIPVALASYAITLARFPIVAFVAGLGLIFLLRYLMRFTGIDTSKFKRKDWLGHGSIVFFSWLAFWILLLNAPFADLTRPDIINVAVATTTSMSTTSLVCKNLSPGDNPPLAGGVGNTTLYVTFRATDNVAVASTDATVNGQPVVLSAANGATNRCQAGTVYPSGTWEGFVSPLPGFVTLTIHAIDTSGNSYALTFKFTIA